MTKVIKVGGETVTVKSKKNLKKSEKLSKSLKNGLARAILGKRDKSDQSWKGKRDRKT